MAAPAAAEAVPFAADPATLALVSAAYRLIAGQRVAFVGPKTYWIETYATAKRDTKAPNSMWAKAKALEAAIIAAKEG
ncbi:hypothetical protein [uncultured Brevundimonas sp.]|uniref:hypothetical protein n=1 Tax=uncultured Brevundimonas sp. TaxID=213418 RepID=UPI0025EEC4D6|nr:hypothetical protein [uncultured Brevundimonas sp.]